MNECYPVFTLFTFVYNMAENTSLLNNEFWEGWKPILWVQITLS